MQSRPSLLKIDEVATILRVSTETVRRLVSKGRLASVRVAPRTLRVTQQSVDDLLGIDQHMPQSHDS